MCWKYSEFPGTDLDSDTIHPGSLRAGAPHVAMGKTGYG